MNENVSHENGVDVSKFDATSSSVILALKHSYENHPQYRGVVDFLNTQFSHAFSEEMLKFHSRSETMCEPLYDYLSKMVNDYHHPLCTALVHFVSKERAEGTDLAMYFKLLLNPNYVIKQVGVKTFNKLRFSAQQVLRLSSVKQVDAFINAFGRYPSALTAEEQFTIIAGALSSFKHSSGLPSGDLVNLGLGT